MKNFFLLLLASLLLFNSCNSDDDNIPVESSSIIGKWNIYKITWFDTNGNQIDEAIWAHNCPTKRDFYEFNNDGSCERAEHNDNCELDNHSYIASWSQNGNL